jgi:hypothetical protein
MKPEATAARQPLFWAAVCFAAGILAGTYCWRPALWWLVAAVIFILAALQFRGPKAWRSTLAWTMALSAVAATGAWSAQVYRPLPLPDISRFADGFMATVTAHVVRDGVAHGASSSQRQTVDLQTETIERDGEAVAVSAGLRLSLFGPGLDHAIDEAQGEPGQSREESAQYDKPIAPII